MGDPGPAARAATAAAAAAAADSGATSAASLDAETKEPSASLLLHYFNALDAEQSMATVCVADAAAAVVAASSFAGTAATLATLHEFLLARHAGYARKCCFTQPSDDGSIGPTGMPSCAESDVALQAHAQQSAGPDSPQLSAPANGVVVQWYNASASSTLSMYCVLGAPDGSPDAQPLFLQRDVDAVALRQVQVAACDLRHRGIRAVMANTSAAPGTKAALIAPDAFDAAFDTALEAAAGSVGNGDPVSGGGAGDGSVWRQLVAQHGELTALACAFFGAGSQQPGTPDTDAVPVLPLTAQLLRRLPELFDAEAGIACENAALCSWLRYALTLTLAASDK